MWSVTSRYKRLDQCLCVGAYFATIFSFVFVRRSCCLLYLFGLFFVCFTRFCICDSGGICDVGDGQKHRYCSNYCERSAYGARGFIRGLAALTKSELLGFNLFLCHVLHVNKNVDAQCRRIQRRQAININRWKSILLLRLLHWVALGSSEAKL